MMLSCQRSQGWSALVALCLTLGCQSGAQTCYHHFLGQASHPADISAAAHEVQEETPAVESEAPPAPDGERFDVPAELPGASAGPLQMPAFDATQSPEARRSTLEAVFPDVPGVSISATGTDESFGLSELQSLALQYSPIVQQAAAEVENQRGAMVQAGLYPNPTVGYEGDSLGTSNTAGYNGVFVTQEFVTAGKLSLAQSAALMKMRAAEQDLRKARIALASDVRRGYFNVLVAQERLKFAQAISQLSGEVYQAQIDLVAAGEAAPYEPLQLRVFAVQARNGVVQAENGLQAAWRQLVASIGLPQMQRHVVRGSVEMVVPDVDYDAAAAFLLSQHTDLAASRARISGACYNVQLQEVTPIPNITMYGTFQHDDTTPLNNFASNVQIGIPLPIYNRNEGNISSAHAQLTQANQALTNVRNELLGSLADAHNRYATSKVIAESYRQDVLNDQVRVYRGVYERFRRAGGDVDFAQVVVSQQTLATAVNEYLTALGNQWQATVDLAELLQVDDLYSMTEIVGRVQSPMKAEPLAPPAIEMPANKE